MKINLNYDLSAICRTVMKEQLQKLNIEFELSGFGEIILKKSIPHAVYLELQRNLARYGISIMDDQRSQLIQKIKNAILELIEMEVPPNCKTSHYLAEKLDMNYCYMSTIFSEYTSMSIESYIILQRIERAKRLFLQKLSMSEVSYLLNYSSPAHLSGQFKKVTGLTPSSFKKIIETRNSKLYSR